MPSDPQALVEGSIGDAERLNPITASDGASRDITGLVFNGLVKYNPKIELVSDLASSFDVSPDCRKVMFHLRRGVKWHDGVEFTADDVKFTYDQITSPKVASPYSADFERVKSVRALDRYTVQVDYREPFAPGLESWGLGVIPKHLLEGKNIMEDPFNRKPVGTGPYRFGEWRTQERIVLEANPDYFEGRPGVARYLYRIIPDTATQFLELRSGGLDLMALTPTQFRRQTETAFFKKTFHRFRYPALGYTYIGYNLKDPKFADRRVRQALTHLIDRQAIVDGVLLGLGRIATGPYIPESWAYNPEVKPLPYDPGKGKALLAEAGWKDTDGDGILDKNGKPFAFTILTNQGNEQRKQAAEIIQRNLRAAGIQVEIRVVEWQAFLRQFVDQKRFEAIVLGWGVGLDPDIYTIWHSSKTGEREFNFISYQNGQVDRLLVEGRQTCDKERRRRIYREVHRLIAEDQPYTFLYYPDALPIVHQRFKGVKPSPIGLMYNFIEWKVPKDAAEWYREESRPAPAP